MRKSQRPGGGRRLAAGLVIVGIIGAQGVGVLTAGASGTVPNAPAKVYAVAGTGVVQVLWTAATPHGTPISSYTVSVKTTGGPNLTCSTSTGTLTCVVASGVVPGDAYAVSVAAVNGKGTGPATTAGSKVTPQPAPAAVATAPTATAHPGSARVKWTAPPTNGSGVAITGYVVTETTIARKVACRSTSPATTTCTVSGLVNGTSYSFRVQPTYGSGKIGEYSLPSNRVVPKSVPTKPTPPAVSATKSGTIVTVKWNSATPEGTPILKYVVTSSGIGKTCTVTFTAHPGNSLNCKVSGLTNGTSYTFTVKGINKFGTGKSSLPSAPVTPASPPAAKPKITHVADDPGATAVKVTFSGIGSTTTATGGDPVSNYVIQAQHTSSNVGSPTTVGPTKTSATVSGLTYGTQYRFTVCAKNIQGTGPCAQSTIFVPKTKPDAITKLSAVAADKSVQVAWTPPVTNGTAIKTYNVVDTATHTKSCTVAVTKTSLNTCTVGGLTNGNSYQFTVNSTNGVGTSSTSVTPTTPVTPGTLPAAATNLKVVAGASDVQISWTPPVANGTPAVKGYTATAISTAKLKCATTTATAKPTCTVNGLKPGTTYAFRVRAHNTVGTGPYSVPSTPVSPDAPPSAPTNVTVNRGNQQISVNWNKSTGNGAPISKYVVTSTPGGKTCTTTGVTPSQNCTVHNLTNGTAYSFSVVASNTVGSSKPSTPSPKIIPATHPSVAPVITPISLANTEVATGLTIHWVDIPATKDGGLPVTTYTINLTLITTPHTHTSVNRSVKAGTSPQSTFTNLRYYHKYQFQIRARNTVGTGTTSSVKFSTLYWKPAAPIHVVATAGNGYAEVSWTYSITSGIATHGAQVTKWTVTSTPGGKTCTTTGKTTKQPRAQEATASIFHRHSVFYACTVPGLAPTVSYTFKVAGTNKRGLGASSASTNAVEDKLVPVAPSALKPVAHLETVKLTWSSLSGTNPTNVTNFAVYAETANSILTRVCTVANTISTCTSVKLQNGTNYFFRIAAVNANGQGPLSSVPTATVIPSTLPSAPSATSASPKNGAATVFFHEPTTNGTPVVGFTISATTPGQPSIVKTNYVPTTTTINGTRYKFGIPGVPYVAHFTGLTNGRKYTFRVAGRNFDGVGATSTPSQPVKPVGSPIIAPAITSVIHGNKTVTVTWSTVPTDTTVDGGLPINGYRVSGNSQTNKASQPNAATVGNKVFTHTFTNLTNGDTYTFKVQAKNQTGSGPTSANSAAARPSTTPGPPRQVLASAGNGDAVVLWTAPTTTGGNAISSYKISTTPPTSDHCPPLTKIQTTFCTVSGLTNGTSYRFTVRAGNANGLGTASTLSAAVTPKAGLASAPSTVTAVGHVGFATVSWKISTAASVTGYNVISKATGAGRTATAVCSTSGRTKVSCSVNNLAAYTNYTFMVQAVDPTGNGLWSPPTKPVQTTPVPPAPTTVNANSNSPTTATVSWKAVTGNGITIELYTVVGTPKTPTCSTTKSTTHCTVSGLTNGHSYSFRVKATNINGTGPLSSASSAVIPSGPPLIAPVATATAGNTSIKVTWKDIAIATDGGSLITTYVIKWKSGNSTRNHNVKGATTYTIPTLFNGTPYFVSIFAKNGHYTGPATTFATVVPKSHPAAPTNVRATAQFQSAVVVWTAPSDEGTPITTSVVTSNPGGHTCTPKTPAVTTCVVTGLTNGVPYTFQVHAVNKVGPGPTATKASPSVVPTKYPLKPIKVVATPKNKGLTVKWQNNTSPTSPTPTTYKAYLTPSSGQTPCSTLGTNSDTCTFSGLTNGLSYTVRVRGFDAHGGGPLSTASSPVTPSTVPLKLGTPKATTVGSKGSQRAQVTWSVATGSTDGSAITGFVVTSTPGGQTCSASSIGTSCTVYGLKTANYTFTVRATNANGSGATSTRSNSVAITTTTNTTNNTVPNPPTTVTGKAAAGQVRVSWKAPSNNGGLAIARYTVTATPSGKICRTTGGTTCPVSGLTNGSSYVFRVRAGNSKGTSSTSLASTPVTPASAPLNGPSNLTGVPGNKQVTISWKDLATSLATNGGAAITGYNVKIHQGTFSKTVPVPTPNKNSVVITGLTNGTTYRVTVWAINSAGAGPTSSLNGNIKPATTPTAPTITTLSPENGGIVVSWKPPTTIGGTKITRYVVTAFPTTTKTCTWSSGQDTCAVTGLADGAKYTFKVKAHNGVGTSPTSSASLTASPAAVPAAPILTFVADDTATSHGTTVTVQWTKAPTTGEVITSYMAVATNVTTKKVAGSCSTTSKTFQCTISGLKFAQQYSIAVSAADSLGTGPFSTTKTVIPHTRPAAPTGVKAKAGKGQATVTWTLSSTAHGTPITGYTVTSTPGGKTCSAGSVGTSCSVGGLTNGTSYKFHVVAVNKAGNSPTSAPSTPVKPVSTPPAPTSVTVTAANSSVIVTWVQTTDGGSTLTSFTVVANPSGKKCATVPGSARTCTILGLQNGTTYKVSVRATNVVGTGQAQTSPPVIPASLPTPPLGALATPGTGSAVVSWQAPASNGGATITAYHVAETGTGAKSCTWNSSATGGAFRCTVSGLTNHTKVKFIVTATNRIGTSHASAASNTVTPGKYPPAPLTPAVPTVGTGTLTVTWSPPSSTTGSIVSYTAYAEDPGLGKTAGSCSLTVSKATKTHLKCQIKTLPNGVSYLVTVASVGATGPGSRSGAVKAEPSGPPLAPTSLIPTPSNNRIKLNWTASTTQGSPITSYVVTRTGTKSACTTQVHTGKTATTCTVTGLNNGTSYTFKVVAKNAKGTSPAATLKAVAGSPSRPQAPTGIKAVAGNASVTVSWTAPGTDGNTTITKYTVTSTPTKKTCTWNNGPLTCTVSNLNNGTTYTFSVTATNGQGTGSSSLASGKVKPVVPQPPTYVTATAGNGQVLVTWTPSTTSGVTKYVVTSNPPAQTCTWTKSGGKTIADGAPYCVVGGLHNNTSYSFTVVAKVGTSQSAPSSKSNNATPSSSKKFAPGGYWEVTSNGALYTFGNAQNYGHAGTSSIIGLARTGNDRGYWEVTSAGVLYAFGNAAKHGTLKSTHLNAPVVGFAAMPSGAGYWMVTENGTIHAFGAAKGGGVTGLKGVVGITGMPTGKGCWIVNNIGIVKHSGSAKVLGTLPARHVTPSGAVTGITSTSTGTGFWLVTSAGQVYEFGNARNNKTLVSEHKSTGTSIIGLTPTPTGKGYWLVNSGGTVFNFGSALTYGSAHTSGVVGFAGV